MGNRNDRYKIGGFMKIEYKKISEITPYENNPRINDEAVKYVANSIKEFGFKNPIIIDSGGVIIAGHTRLKAAIELGMEEVPTITADYLTEEQVNAFRLADNKVSEKAHWDLGMLEEELANLDIDMEDFGFDRFDELDNNITSNKEISIGDYDDEEFKHECPKCHFKFN